MRLSERIIGMADKSRFSFIIDFGALELVGVGMAGTIGRFACGDAETGTKRLENMLIKVFMGHEFETKEIVRGLAGIDVLRE